MYPPRMFPIGTCQQLTDPLGFDQDGPSSRHTHLDTMNITQRSSKDEIVTAACELISSQDKQITDLQQRQTALALLLGIVLVWSLL